MFSALQTSRGGVFWILDTASATFKSKVVMDSNGVSFPYSGGAVYADGNVRVKCSCAYKWRFVE